MDNEKITQKEYAKILVVDDDLLLRTFLEKALQSGGYLCTSAEDGHAALELLQKNPFDMVISDIEMPQLNGLELLYRIRTKYPSIKTILISGKYQRTDTINGLSAKGAHSFLPKPFSLNRLLSTVQAVLCTP